MDRITSGFTNRENRSITCFLHQFIGFWLPYLRHSIEILIKTNRFRVTTERIVRMVRMNSIACGATARAAYAEELKPMPESDACGGIDYDTR